MSYRIITYKDPYTLQNTGFWESIRTVPHFCASDVMALSMWDRYVNKEFDSEGFQSFFWPLQALVDAAYGRWVKSIEDKIRQHIALKNELNALNQLFIDKGCPKEKLFSSLQLNKESLINTLRLFRELDVELDSLHSEEANEEQKALIYLYKRVCTPDGNELHNAFKLPNNLARKPRELFLQLIKESIDNENNRAKEDSDESDPLAQITRNKKREVRVGVLKDVEKQILIEGVPRIVIHGIHQFKPLQLRLISTLNEMGVEIIFLYNYNSTFLRCFQGCFQQSLFLCNNFRII